MSVTADPPTRSAPAHTATIPTAASTDGAPREKLKVGQIATYAGLVLLMVVVLFPFLWMILSSFKHDNQVLATPFRLWPEEWVWSNYVDIWTRVPMAGYLGNTLILAATITALQVLTGSFAAYGFAKVRFPGRDALFLAYIATLAVPWQAYMIPQYIMVNYVGLSNTFWALILLNAFNAFGVFLMRQFYSGIPDEIIEAARIDGLSDYGIWARIMLPLSKPALASLALLTFVAVWNDFMGPFIYLSSKRLWTVQIGLQQFVSMYGAEFAMIMTGSVISIIPILTIFLLGQRYFVQGIATTGMK